jgi:hypothetical protein
VGTYIHVYMSHDLPRFDDASDTMARLASSLPAALALRDYWRSADPGGNALDEWKVDRMTSRKPDLKFYEGPGDLFLGVTPAAARIITGGRWRGFLSIEALREAHLAAFRAVARAMGSAKLALCSDAFDDVSELFYANASQAQCVEQMRAAMGPPQPSVETIAPDVIAQTEHGVLNVWFLDGEADPD